MIEIYDYKCTGQIVKLVKNLEWLYFRRRYQELTDFKASSYEKNKKINIENFPNQVECGWDWDAQEEFSRCRKEYSNWNLNNAEISSWDIWKA